MNTFQKIKLTLTNINKPEEFWNKISEETGIRGAVIYVWTIIPVLFVLAFIAHSLIGTSINIPDFFGAYDISPTVLSLIIVAIPLVWFFIGSFIVSCLLHLFMKLFKGQGKFHKTYQAVVYGYTPMFLWTLVALLLLFLPKSITVSPNAIAVTTIIKGIFWLWVLSLIITGLKKFHNVSFSKVVMAMISSFIIFVLAIFVIIFFVAPNILIPEKNIIQQTISESVNNTDEKVYQNEKYGFEFKYPTKFLGNFSQDESERYGYVVSADIVGGNALLSIRVTKPEDVGQTASYGQIVTTREILIGGENAIQMDVMFPCGEDSSETQSITTFIHKNLGYEIRVSEGGSWQESCGKSYKNYSNPDISNEEFLSAIERIYSTFKFIN